jgi:thiol-disulfide isomerase/thioredoxin
MTDADVSDPPVRRQRRLPVGPVGLLVITAISLVVALAAARLVVGLLSEPVPDVQDVLDDQAQAPLVSDVEARVELDGPAPNVRLEFLDGGTQQLAEIAGVGTPVVLNFWASTCIPCLNEMPALEEVSNELDGAVTFLGVAVADGEDAAREMVERTGVTYRNARDPRSEIFAVYGGIALPRTVVITGDGTVVETHSGELDAQDVRDLLARHDLLPT